MRPPAPEPQMASIIGLNEVGEKHPVGLLLIVSDSATVGHEQSMGDGIYQYFVSRLLIGDHLKALKVCFPGHILILIHECSRLLELNLVHDYSRPLGMIAKGL